MKIEEKRTFETFRELGSYDIGNLTHSEPTSFNGNVRVVKYRVTIEPVEEPDQVIHGRLQKLWDECDNHHHWEPLKQEANKHGYVLLGSPGSKRVKK